MSKRGDLFVLTADADALAIMKSILERPQSLGIRPISYKIERQPGHDPGIMKSGPVFEYVMLEKKRTTISPRDFEFIASKASLRSWKKSVSFQAIVETLQKWFPSN